MLGTRWPQSSGQRGQLQRSSVSAGEIAPVSCTLPYSPPEIVLASVEGRQVEVQPSHDVWAIAVMSYEALTHGRALVLQSTVRHSKSELGSPI